MEPTDIRSAGRRSDLPTAERHYTVDEVAELWNVSRDTAPNVPERARSVRDRRGAPGPQEAVSDAPHPAECARQSVPPSFECRFQAGCWAVVLCTATIDRYLLHRGDAAANRSRLRSALEAEIANTKEWLQILRESRTYFFRVAEVETPFLYKTPIEDMALKLEAMQAHIGDEPGPYRKELAEPFSAQHLLYM